MRKGTLVSFKLKQAKIKTNPHQDLYRKRLEGKKWLGAGVGGKVHKHSKGKVIKYFTDDAGYLAFIKALAALKTPNPYFPVIYSASINEKHSAGIVIMEELAELDDCCFSESQTTNMSDLEYQLYKTACNSFEDVVRSDKELVEHERNWVLAGDYQLNAAINVLRKTLRNGRKNRVRIDMHTGNFMARLADGHLVITDPFYRLDK